MEKKSLITVLCLLLFCFQLTGAQEIKEISTDKDSNSEGSKDIPFIIMDEVPIFPGCENGSQEDRKYCLNKKLQMHIARKFNSSMANTLGLSEGRYKVFINFRINQLGLPDSVKVRAPHPILEKEAIRVVNALPKIVPGKLRGKNVAVNYTLPINLYVDEPKNNIKKNKKKIRNN